MKIRIVTFGFTLFVGQVSSGQDSNDFFFDELHISLNRTHLQDNNTEDRYGFGIGAYHLFLSDQKVNLVLGLEYNRISQVKKSIYEGHFAHATDLTYTLDCFSVPIGLRYNMGSKTKFFIETGGFADMVISSRRSGTLHTYLPDENNQIKHTTTAIDEQAELSNSFGIYFGLGIRIPIANFELIVKPDYKWAMNKLYSNQDVLFNRYFRINIGLKIN